MAMMQKKAGLTGNADEYVVAVPDPSAEGGVRYLDTTDGEDLGRYGTECTARYDACAAAEARKQELKAFHDGLRDPVANDQQHHKDTTLLMYSALRTYISDELQKGFADWGADWYRLRNAPTMRRALRSSVPEVDRKGLSCMASVPPDGPAHELEVNRACVSSITQLVYPQPPGVAYGLSALLVVRANLHCALSLGCDCSACSGPPPLSTLCTVCHMLQPPSVAIGATDSNDVSVSLPQWTIYKTYSMRDFQGNVDSQWQEPFTAGGLAWWVYVPCVSEGTTSPRSPSPRQPLSSPSSADAMCSGNLHALGVRARCVWCPPHLDTARSIAPQACNPRA